jgi:glycosyltransferase involved in cell wall biosynthesis
VRVLLIAEEANPEWVSVPLVGWAHSRAIAGLVDAHVVTQVRNRDAFLRAGRTEREFTAIDNESIAHPLWRLGQFLRGGQDKGWTTLAALKVLSYRSFERRLWRRFGAEIRKGGFDIVHRLTPLSPAVPSRLAGLCRHAGVPFVLGPLNGGVPWPRGFDRARRREREWLSYVREIHRLLPGYRSTRRNASALVLGSRETWRQMPSRYRDRCVYLPENAVDPARFDLGAPLPARSPGPLRVVFVGRLVPLKGVDMLLEAVSDLVRSGRVVLDVIGDGPDRPALEQAVSRLGLGSAVSFAGWVPHDQVPRRLRRADVFGFPSIREFGGGVVLEAMAEGVVPVVLDYGGPGELVSKGSGFALPMGSREEIIVRFREVLSRLAGDPTMLAPMAELARHRVRKHFTWEAKAGQMLRIYDWVLGRAEKPDFGMPLSE